MTVCSDVVSCKPVMSVQCVVVRAIFCSLCLSSRHVKVMVFPVSQGSVKHSRRFIILKLDVTSSEQFCHISTLQCQCYILVVITRLSY